MRNLTGFGNEETLNCIEIWSMSKCGAKQGHVLGTAFQKEGLAYAEKKMMWLEHIPGAMTTMARKWLFWLEHKGNMIHSSVHLSSYRQL